MGDSVIIFVLTKSRLHVDEKSFYDAENYFTFSFFLWNKGIGNFHALGQSTFKQLQMLYGHCRNLNSFSHHSKVIKLCCAVFPLPIVLGKSQLLKKLKVDYHPILQGWANLKYKKMIGNAWGKQKHVKITERKITLYSIGIIWSAFNICGFQNKVCKKI